MKFPWSEYEDLARLASEIEGTMIISINDHPQIRELFADLPVVEVDYKYTVGGADKSASCKELIYGTWEGGSPKPRGQVSLGF